MRSGGKRGGETSSPASLTQGFGSRAKKTSGHTTGALPQRGSVQLRGSHAQCQAQSQPAQHPSAGVGPQVSLCSLCCSHLPPLLYFLLPHFPILPPLRRRNTYVPKTDEKKFRPSSPRLCLSHLCVPISLLWSAR